jgi:hypothetical protein
MGQAARRLSEFVGREIGEFVEVKINPDYNVGYVLGEIPELHYIAERDGEVFHFDHKFKAASRPLLVVSFDGKQLMIAGGRYSVTDRGIVDR